MFPSHDFLCTRVILLNKKHFLLLDLHLYLNLATYILLLNKLPYAFVFTGSNTSSNAPYFTWVRQYPSWMPTCSNPPPTLYYRQPPIKWRIYSEQLILSLNFKYISNTRNAIIYLLSSVLIFHLYEWIT